MLLVTLELAPTNWEGVCPFGILWYKFLSYIEGLSELPELYYLSPSVS